MKNLFSIAMAVMFSVMAYAQQDVTRFLGIPVDGSKSGMISKLKTKGYQYVSELDCLEGEFNGTDVKILIVTNNNKVWRIAIIDDNTKDVSQIRLRFNMLCKQFENNSKYASFGDQTISEDEDISYEITVHDKQYQASFYQKSGTTIDAAIENRSVWFTIVERYGKYCIAMFYDNKYNQANGEDL